MCQGDPPAKRFLKDATVCKGTLLGTPNGEPQEYSRNIMEYKDPGRYIPIIYLLYSWGSLFGVPSRVPLVWDACKEGALFRTISSVYPKSESLYAKSSAIPDQICSLKSFSQGG